MGVAKEYAADLKREFSGYSAQKLTKDLLAGLTVTAVAIPLALAFGVACGADAASGMITAILAGIVIGMLSGGSYQISGPTGAMTAVLVVIVQTHGLNGVFIAAFISGVLLLLAGICKLGKIISFIPSPVITGFTSGIAVIIALGQVDNFFGVTSTGKTTLEKLLSYFTVGFNPNLSAVLIGSIVMATMLLWPKKWNQRFPSSLVGIILALLVNMIFKLPVNVIGDIPKTLFPENRLDLSAIDFTALSDLIVPAISIAALGMVESLLCGASAGKMKNEPLNADRELIAQGVGNMLLPFFGGVPATAAIARTSVAIKSGGQTRLTSVIHSVGLLASMFLLGDVMSQIPLAALAGVLMITAWRMNEWDNIKYIFSKKFKGSIAEYSITMAATVVFDLTIAIVVGVAVSMLLFIGRLSTIHIDVQKVDLCKLRYGRPDMEPRCSNMRVIYIAGPIFFATLKDIKLALAGLEDMETAIFSIRGVSHIDISGLQYLMELCKDYQQRGITVAFCGAQPQVTDMFQRSGLADLIGDERFYWSSDIAIMDMTFDAVQA